MKVPKLTPGPELWLAQISESIREGKPLSHADASRLARIATQSFEVRALQRAYFSGNRTILEQSKAAERNLDELLSAPAQGGLDL